MNKADKQRTKDELLDGFQDLRRRPDPTEVPSQAREALSRLTELKEALAASLNEDPPHHLAGFQLQGSDVKRLARALVWARDHWNLRFELDQRRDREARALSVLRSEDAETTESLGARKTRALRVLGLLPKDGKQLRKRAAPYLLLDAYHRLTSREGMVVVRDDATCALEEDDRAETVKDCPVDGTIAVGVVKRVFGMPSEKSCQDLLINLRACVVELREEYPHLHEVLPEIKKVPNTYPSGSSGPYGE